MNKTKDTTVAKRWIIRKTNVRRAAAVADISGIKNINDIYEHSAIKKWIKLIPTNKTISFDDYNRKKYFIPVADITIDDEKYITGKKQGRKKRNTLIRFNSKIPPKDFTEKAEWLYLLVINNRIVKIGGTRTGLKNRTASYLCGHHIRERNKSGDCSKTNDLIFIYNWGVKSKCMDTNYPKRNLR
jgi:hypothetical protein